MYKFQISRLLSDYTIIVSLFDPESTLFIMPVQRNIINIRISEMAEPT